MLTPIVYLSLIAFIIASRQKITKVTFFPRHYCAIITPEQDYELIITLNQAMDNWDSSSFYPVKATLSHDDPSIQSAVLCSFELGTSQKIACVFTMTPNTLSLHSTLFYLNTLTVAGERIYFQNQALNVSLELNAQYTEYRYADAFQLIDFSKEKNNLFYMSFTKPVDLINSPNVRSIVISTVGGSRINVTDSCYSETANLAEPSTKVLCVLNPRRSNLTNTFYSIQYTDVCGYQINTQITLQVKGVVIEFSENKTEESGGGDWVNKCEANQFVYRNECYERCPENTFYYNKTRLCLEKCLVKMMVQQDESCVKHCSKGYGLVSEYEDKEVVKKCRRCTSGYSLFEACYSMCPIGSRVDKEGLSCQVGLNSNEDEDDDDKRESSEKPIETCEEYNPCENTGKCVIENNEKACICDTNYYGFYCDVKEEEMNEALVLISKSLYVPNSDFLIDVSNPDTKVQFALINHLINQKENFINDNLDFASYILKGTTSTLSLNNSLSHSLLKDPKGIGDLVNLNLKILLSLSTSQSGPRRLVSQERAAMRELSVIQQMNELIDLLNKYLSIHMQAMIVESINLEYSINQLISFMIWTDNVKSRDSAYQKALKKGIAFGDFSVCRSLITDNKVNTYLLLELSPLVASMLKSISEFDTPLVYLKGMSYYGDTLDLTNCPSIPIHFPIKATSWAKLDMEKYSRFKALGIDVYDQLDPAFTSLCFITPRSDYDLPQAYRQLSLYENSTFISATNNKCLYKELNLTSQRVLMLCGYHIDGFIGLFATSQLLTRFDKGNIPIHCVENVMKDLVSNCAFWICLSLMLVFIFVQTLVGVYVNKGVYIDDTHDSNKSISIEEAAINPEENSDKTADSIEKNEEMNRKEMPISDKPINITSSPSRIFFKAVQRNTLLHFPLVNLFVPSIMCPTHFKLALFFFSLMAYFGFNALYFHEGYLEERMLNPNRNSFNYALLNEGVRIFLSLLSLWALVFVIRIISFVPRCTQEMIGKRIRASMFCDERLGIYKDMLVLRLVRDIISYSLMAITTMLLGFYSISFCASYPNSATGWAYSSIWTFILNWAVAAPLYLVILSALEAVFSIERCLYVVKKLVFF